MALASLSYSDTLAYLYAQLPMYHRIGAAAYKKDLTNTRALCAMLGEPQQFFPTIHVAGTNGKGSVSHAVAAMLQAAGYKVGLYISPHYLDFRERIKINGEYISEAEVVDFVQQYRLQFEAIAPSFFELTVAMAFEHFRRHAVEVAVIETGLGGRLDSTNVITPLLSVITNISYDHQNMLGNTLSEIAAEKAGIIKAGVPVLIGERQAETEVVFVRTAAQKNAPLLFADECIEIVKMQHDLSAMELVFYDKKEKKQSLRTLRSDLSASYQQKNLCTTLAAVHLLKPHFPKLSWRAVKNGLAHIKRNTKLIGRWQVLAKKPLLIADSAHNEGGMAELLKQVAQLDFEQWHWVYGCVKDKDVAGILKLLPAQARYYFCKPDIPRGLEAEHLAAAAQQVGLEGEAYSSVQAALAAAQQAAKPEDFILVAGSIFVVAEVLSIDF